MREFMASVAVIVTGILLSVLIALGVWYLLSPAASVKIEVAKYRCWTDGVTMECNRR